MAPDGRGAFAASLGLTAAIRSARTLPPHANSLLPTVRPLRAILVAAALAALTVATAATPVLAQWPTTCVDLNDIVETHLGNHNNVGIYQRVFGDQAEQACQNDHRDDVRGVFAWAFDDSATTAQADTPDLAWPTDCVELNDIVENHLGNHQNVAIYQRVFGDQAEPACRNDHRADVRSVFAWAFDGYTPPPPRVVFASNLDGDFEIYVVNADGSGLTQLTHNAISDGGPAWSPDGHRIAFGSKLDGDFEIYVMNADGTGLTQLTHNADFDAVPEWSPDGHRLAFTSLRHGNREIYVMNADGTGETRLTHNAAWDSSPTWSPGGRLVFESNRDGNLEIYVMNADGARVERLTDNTVQDRFPVWSPDGRRIAFTSDRDSDQEILVMQADGTGVVQITHNQVSDRLPAWSPDGRRLAFQSDRDGDMDIYVMNADGTGLSYSSPTTHCVMTTNPPGGNHPPSSQNHLPRHTQRPIRPRPPAATRQRPSPSCSSSTAQEPPCAPPSCTKCPAPSPLRRSW